MVTHVEYSRRRHPSVEGWIKEQVGFWKEITDYASREGVTVLLENHTEHNPDAIVGLLKELETDNLKACFDVGHYHAFGEKAPYEFIDSYPKGSIAEVHLSDNKGDGDTHLSLGRGTIDFPAFFKALTEHDIRPLYVIEAKRASEIIEGFIYLLIRCRRFL
jgi:sugar phosphate isomerase/epimerase